MAHLNWRKHGNLAVLAALLAILASRDLGVLSLSNMTNVLGQAAVMGICAVGMTFVILTGGIDLSVGSIVALSGALGAWFNVHAGFPWPTAWAVAILAGALCGLSSGLLVHWGVVPPFMASLALMAGAWVLTLLLTLGIPGSCFVSHPSAPAATPWATTPRRPISRGSPRGRSRCPFMP